jgi:glycosyltransferase involved in cell wall biosynthesis
MLIEEFDVDPAKIYVIPHGPMFHDMPRPARVDARARLGFGATECVVLAQGFIAPYKGINFLLESWAQVQRQQPGARLVVAGSGQARWLTELQEKVAALDIADSVRLEFRFIPAEDLPAFFQAADILVYPYNEITGSGALMTGLTFRKAIVATDLPAFREVLTSNQNALLASYNDVKGFADALLKLIVDPVMRDRLAANAAKIPESWSDIATKTRDCYESLCNPRD